MHNAETKSTGENTPESENAYHHKQLMEVHHTLMMREQSVNKNMWKRRCERKNKIGVSSKRKRKEDSPPKQSRPRIEEEEKIGISVEVIPDADLDKWKELEELATYSSLFDKVLNGFDKITMNMKDVRFFIEGQHGEPQVTDDFILRQLPSWTLSLGAYGWGSAGGTIALQMDNKTMIASKQKFGRLQYTFDFCNIVKLLKGPGGQDATQEWQTIYVWLKNAPSEGEIAYSTKRNGRHGMSGLESGLIDNYIKTGETHFTEIGIGKKVRKKFDDDKWYNGKVVSIDTQEGDTQTLLYHVLYEDGDEEDLTGKELQDILVGEDRVATRLAREQTGYRKLAITVMQSMRCKERLGIKVDHLVECITEFSEHTRGAIDEDCEIEKVKAPIPAKNDNIYNWSDDTTHTKRTTTVIDWIDELFARIHGGPCKNRYKAICTCRKICEISRFGMRLSEGKPHYECVQAVQLNLDEYLKK